MDPKEFIKGIFEEFRWELFFLALFLIPIGIDGIRADNDHGCLLLFFAWAIIKRLRFHPVQGYKNFLQTVRKILRRPAKQK